MMLSSDLSWLLMESLSSSSELELLSTVTGRLVGNGISVRDLQNKARFDEIEEINGTSKL